MSSEVLLTVEDAAARLKISNTPSIVGAERERVRLTSSPALASCATKNLRSKIGLATALVVRRASQEDDRGAQ
jgi:hypothetical protein